MYMTIISNYVETDADDLQASADSKIFLAAVYSKYSLSLSRNLIASLNNEKFWTFFSSKPTKLEIYMYLKTFAKYIVDLHVPNLRLVSSKSKWLSNSQVCISAH